MRELVISNAEARSIVLSAQGLVAEDAGAITALARAQAAIEHLGYVQIDTISVVERAHHHVLWTRSHRYRPEFLSQLVNREKTVFEYWSHAASFLPMRDFRFSLPRKHLYASGKRHWFTQTSEHKKLRRTILARIREEGPLASRDFESETKRKGTGWFDRKPAKLVLEQLFMEGKLMAGRRGFEKLYDLTENTLPSQVDTRFPTERERARHLIETSLRQLGLARADEISYLRSALREPVRTECKRLLKEGELREVRVEGIERPFLMNGDWASKKREPSFVSRGKAGSAHSAVTRLLSPFDNLVIQRKRMTELFGFDYLIECYVPEAKRKFGYFCLPVLQDDSFIGRLDAKAERERGVLNVRAFHEEDGVKFDRTSLDAELQAFAEFNGCPTVEWTKRKKTVLKTRVPSRKK